MSAAPMPNEHAQGRRNETPRECRSEATATGVPHESALVCRTRQETPRMTHGAPRRPPAEPSNSRCELSSAGSEAALTAGSWAAPAHEPAAARERLARLVHTLESDVIPRLVGAHRADKAAPPAVPAAVVERFVGQLRQADLAAIDHTVDNLLRQGVSVELVYLELLAPAARRLGELWEADTVDFSTVTLGVGRLQRLLRALSPAFGNEIEHPPNGRRVLLLQPSDEQHSFGLSMVAEFFRREGWEVRGGVGGSVPDPALLVAREWFDVVGFSIGSQTRLDWLRERITQVRAATRNASTVVLVGGPLFVLHPEWAEAVGADAMGRDGARAPLLAEELLSSRVQRR